MPFFFFCLLITLEQRPTSRREGDERSVSRLVTEWLEWFEDQNGVLILGHSIWTSVGETNMRVGVVGYI